MALNDAAADACLDTWASSFTGITPAQQQSMKDGMRALVRALYAGIVANAVVSPVGSPTALNVGGTAVTGTGKIT